MSYDVAIVDPPVAADDGEAWADFDRLINAEGPVPSVFSHLLERLTARYPCISDLGEEHLDEGVWSDGPLAENLGHRASVFGMIPSRVEEVLPFVIREASELGLVVFDLSRKAIHRPRPRPIS